MDDEFESFGKKAKWSLSDGAKWGFIQVWVMFLL